MEALQISHFTKNLDDCIFYLYSLSYGRNRTYPINKTHFSPPKINFLFRLTMNVNLSIINEDVNVGSIKEIGETSNDSGINSNTSSSDASNNEASNNDLHGDTSGTGRELRDIIIPFKALNMGRKESTILASSSSKASCNISNIDGSDSHKNTIDSDGKTLKTQGIDSNKPHENHYSKNRIRLTNSLKLTSMILMMII